MNRLYSRRQALLAMTLSLSGGAVLLAGCGSGSGNRNINNGLGGSNSGGGTSSPTRSTGRVVLPPGSPLALANLKLTSGFAPAALKADGSFTLDQISGDSALLLLTDTQGQPLLMGFSGSTATSLVGEVSAAQTAVALTFYALGAFTLPAEAQEQVRVLLAKDEKVQAIGSKVAETLAANPLAIAQSDPALFAAVTALRDTLLGATRHVTNTPPLRSRQEIAPTLIQVSPENEVAGFQASPNGEGLGLTISNARRRNALMYVYEISYTDANEVVRTPTAHVIVGGEYLPATSGFAGVVGSLVDYVNGTSVYTPVTKGPFSLDLFPSDATKAKYHVDLVSSGNGGDPQNIRGEDAAYEIALVKMSFLTFAKDLLLPAVATIVGFPTSLKTGLELETIVGTELLKAYDDLAVILSGVVDSGVAISQDNARDLLIAVLKALGNNATLRQIFIKWITINSVRLGFGPGLYGVIGGAFATGLNAATAIVDKALGVLDLGSVIADWGRPSSFSFIRFEAQAIIAKVRISPAEATIQTGETQKFLANIPLQADNITYQWTITQGEGTLTNPASGLTGKALDSSAPTINYQAEKGTDTTAGVKLQVEAFLGGVNNPNRKSIGKATATITLTDEKKPYVIESFVVDDNMTLWLNGKEIYRDTDGALSGSRGPFTLTDAKKGDTVRLQVRDYYGLYASVSDVVLRRPDGTEKLWIEAFQLQTAQGNKTVILDKTLTLD